MRHFVQQRKRDAALNVVDALLGVKNKPIVFIVYNPKYIYVFYLYLGLGYVYNNYILSL